MALTPMALHLRPVERDEGQLVNARQMARDAVRTTDAVEGMSAFLQKPRPAFRDG
jgi:hypothetical protein